MLRKILAGAGILIAFIIVLITLSVVSAKNTPPPELAANFVNLDQITKISKYRSCAGHVTVPQNGIEARNSMKHYYWVKPELVGTKEVKIYAPYDGYVSSVRSDPEENLEGEIWIVPKRGPLQFLPLHKRLLVAKRLQLLATLILIR